MIDVSFTIAFLAGLVSFLAPCVLPIIPGFLSYLAGSTLYDAASRRGEIFLHSLFFVLGFSLVFSSLGVLLNTLLERSAYDVQLWLSRIGGILIIFFGLYLARLIHIPFLEREHKFSISKKMKSRYLTSLLFGSAFAAGWTPCVGAALGAILGIAVTQPGKAFYLLMSYSAGLGLPFLIVGFFAAQSVAIIKRFSKFLQYINILFGIILVIFGILIFTQSLNLIANFGFLNNILLSE